CNIGLLLGKPSGWLLDVDFDCSETVALASEFLPPTGRISGRKGKPRSHFWYISQDAKSVKFQAPDGQMLVELRSTGGQTVVPPSIHPSGEAVVWYEEGEPRKDDFESLRTLVSHLAAAALLARYCPGSGSRQDAALAASGLLLRGGIVPEVA